MFRVGITCGMKLSFEMCLVLLVYVGARFVCWYESFQPREANDLWTHLH